MKIGYIVGVFDNFHYGHHFLITRAKELCDHLIIAVHTDEFVKSYKRIPKQDEITRQNIIKKLNFTDDVLIIDDNHKLIIDKYKVNIIFHGDDWELESYKKQIKYYEHGFDKSNIEIVLLSYTKGISSTKILNNEIPNILKYDEYLFDLDNTLVIGTEPMVYAKEFVDILLENNKSVKVLTNNNHYTPDELYNNLSKCGFKFKIDDIYTSLIHIYNEITNRNYSNIYVWGSESSKKWLVNKGLKLNNLNPEVIIILYNNKFDYTELVTLLNFCKKLPYLIGNIDFTYPDKNNILPDTGSIYNLVKNCTNNEPLQICGKSNKNMYKVKKNSVVIGDSLLTDKLFAEKNNIDFLHVHKDYDITNMGVLCEYAKHYT